MGEIVHKIGAGSVRGLIDMGFLEERPCPPGRKKPTYKQGEVQDAFVNYYNWITSALTEEEKLRWRWNVVTAENHLCKHHRLLKYVDGLKEES